MFLVVGLGNPGKHYHLSRHNAGFMVIDKIAEKTGVSVKKRGFISLYGKGLIENKEIILAKPQTYMNLSGEAVLEFIEFFKIPIEKTIVIHDDLYLTPGTLRIKRGGGSGGHKGISSIMGAFGSGDFTRIRVGIGKPAQKWDVTDYVLSPFEDHEKEAAQEAIKRAAAAVCVVVGKGVESAMNIFNQKVRGAAL